MGRRTPLYDIHVAAGARMVDFGGWDMPVGYGSQIEEHHAVRRDAGMFDVSHMCAVDLRGAGVRPLLLRLLANDVGRLAAAGKALYSCMLRPDGGIIDDLIACRLDDRWFRVVVNAGTVSTLRLRGNTRPCYNLIELEGRHVDVWRKYPFHGQERIIQFSTETRAFEKYTTRIEDEVTART